MREQLSLLQLDPSTTPRRPPSWSEPVARSPREQTPQPDRNPKQKPEPESELKAPAPEAFGNAVNVPAAPQHPRETLFKHPNLWRAGELSVQRDPGISTGYTQLNAQLPGQGWPSSGLMELLLPWAGVGELRLLLPALAQLSCTRQRWVAWLNPPFIPYAPALQAAGVDINKMLLIHPQRTHTKAHSQKTRQKAHQKVRQKTDQKTHQKTHQKSLWALERACRSGSCSAVLAWLDESKLKLKDTQRLQVAAKQGGTLLCLLRPHGARQHPSMAELRLALARGDAPGNIHVDVFKRRGGWPVQDLQLDLCGQTQHSSETLAEQLAVWRAQQLAKDSVSEPGIDPVHLH